jgi:hypothetical protein
MPVLIVHVPPSIVVNPTKYTTQKVKRYTVFIVWKQKYFEEVAFPQIYLIKIFKIKTPK